MSAPRICPRCSTPIVFAMTFSRKWVPVDARDEGLLARLPKGALGNSDRTGARLHFAEECSGADPFHGIAEHKRLREANAKLRRRIVELEEQLEKHLIADAALVAALGGGKRGAA